MKQCWQALEYASEAHAGTCGLSLRSFCNGFPWSFNLKELQDDKDVVSGVLGGLTKIKPVFLVRAG